MNYHFLFLFLALCVHNCVCVWEGDTTHSLVIKQEVETIVIEPYGRDSLRIRVAQQQVRNDVPGALIPADFSVHEKKVEVKERAIVNGNIMANVGSDNLITVYRVNDGKVLLQEIFRQFKPSPFLDGTFVLNVSYASDPTEAIYGLGEHKTGKLDNKGFAYDFESCHTYDDSWGSQIMIPFYVSNKGYGFLWNLPSYGNVVLNSYNTSWSSSSTYQLDVWVTTSKVNTISTAADVLSNYVDVTGHAPKLPYFASGYWQCKNRYRNQTQLLSVANGYLQRGLPLSVIVIDWYHWTHLGDFRFDLKCWPDPKAMTQQLNSMGIRTMVSVWPLVEPASVNLPTFRDKGFLVKCPATNDVCHAPGPEYLYDATNPAARQFVWEQVNEGYLKNGIGNYWLDASEPEVYAKHPRLFFSIGPQETVGMIWVNYHIETFERGLQSQNQTDTIMLSRSAWAGTQRFRTSVWSGDIPSTWESLRTQVRVGLNMGLSGIVWWTTDIGGYDNGNITDPVWRELIVRWFQYGAFCPLFRSHGHRLPVDPTGPCGESGGPNEIWEFGEEAYTAISAVMHLREQLRIYIMEQMDVAALNGTPVMRPLWFDFPDDLACANIEDQYMFGPLYMVAPVLEYQARSRPVYFPYAPKVAWVHWFTGNAFLGGTTEQNFPAPLNTFPLFVRRTYTD